MPQNANTNRASNGVLVATGGGIVQSLQTGAPDRRDAAEADGKPRASGAPAPLPCRLRDRLHHDEPLATGTWSLSLLHCSAAHFLPVLHHRLHARISRPGTTVGNTGIPNVSDEMVPAMEPDSTDVGQDLIEQDEWANCWLCEGVFRRRTQTKRYCTMCHRGFCEGWHGNFALGRGTCLICITKETGADIHS
jgi:hypothetical protein